MRSNIAKSALASAAMSALLPVSSLAALPNEYAINSGTGSATAPTAAQIKQQNLLSRQAIVGAAIKRQQQIYTNTFDPATGVVLNIQPRYAGLILGFWVEVSATLTLGTANGILTQWGPANFIQQVRFDDLSNNTRIQTTGWHLNAVNSAKSGAPFLAVHTLTNYPVGYGHTDPGIAVATSPLTADGGSAKMTFWVPLAYSDVDLRGAMWANVINATAQLQLTMATSAQAFAANAGDPTSAVYQYDATGATGVITSYTVTVSQVYYDQLPVDPNGNQILPVVDLSTLYMLNNTTLTGMVSGNDFPIPYANFRSFLSTLVIYDNQTGGAYPAQGSDVTYWSLQTANFTNIFKYGPEFPSIYSRLAIGDDMPLGAYYFDTRAKPINTIQFGNQQLILNPNGTVNTNANVKIGWEMFAITNTLVGAASLAGGG